MPRLTGLALTERAIASAGALDRETVLRDATVRGLLARISPTGTKSFAFEYRSPVTGKTTRVTLGPAGLGGIALQTARGIAAQHRAALAAGRCPAAEARASLDAAQAGHAGSASVAAALDRYEAAVITPHPRQVSRRARMQLLRRVCSPWAAKSATSLGRGEIMRRLDEIAAESGPVQANRAQAYLRHALGWLHEREIVEDIVIDRIKRRHREESRERVLSASETNATLRSIRTEPSMSGTAFAEIVELLFFTGMRRGEAAQLQGRDIDVENAVLTVRAEVSKNGRSRQVPLVSRAVEIVRERARGVHKGGYVFGDATVGTRPFSGWGKSLSRLRNQSGVVSEGSEPWSLHDIRRTVATGLIDAGTDTLVVEDLLGHVSGTRRGVAGVYNRATTLERQRKALEAWARTL